MKHRVLFLLAAFSLSAYPQAWSTFLDSSRAVDWTSAGFSIPNYTTTCSTQPTLAANSSSAAANTTAIQNALASCDATHNVVNIPAGTYYVAGITYPSHGKQVLRGAGPKSTVITFTAAANCGGLGHGICMQSANPAYGGSAAVLPPSGTQQCLWTGGLSKGSTTITLTNCGSAPPVNHLLILDQANEATDTGGIYLCDSSNTGCTIETGSNPVGRVISGQTHSQQQLAYMSAVSSLGGGSYSVTISPGVYFNNIRSGQAPGAWWSNIVQNNGIENLTLDGSGVTGNPQGTLEMWDCYQCWAKNIAFLNGARNSVFIAQSFEDVIRDSYFYGAQSHYTESYNIEISEASAILIDNNIFQQTTSPMVFNQTSGTVVTYNFGIDDLYTGSVGYASAAFNSHSAGNDMNLWEGNAFLGIDADDSWGASNVTTYFRNFLYGWENGATMTTVPLILRSWVRAYNAIGNVMGQPGYHTQYQTYSTSSSGGSGGASESKGIYSIGWGGAGVCGSPYPVCDPLAFSTLMRWGNYDTVTAGVKWDSTEASPGAVPYVNANFTSSYFGSLAHTLPASLYYNSTPSWWPSGKAWPPIGPDVTGGTLGTCSGTYSGAQANSPSQCTGGTLTSQWSSHATSIPAQDCYLNVMHGPPDGTGGVLSFDGSACYGSGTGTVTVIASPTDLTVTVN